MVLRIVEPATLISTVTVPVLDAVVREARTAERLNSPGMRRVTTEVATPSAVVSSLAAMTTGVLAATFDGTTNSMAVSPELTRGIFRASPEKLDGVSVSPM